MAETELRIDRGRAAMIIQDLQNDVIIDGGAFAESGAPDHAKSQNVVENVKRLAATARESGMPVIHVHYIVEQGAPGLKQNAPLFAGVREANAPPSMITSFCRSWMISAERLASRRRASSFTDVSF